MCLTFFELNWKKSHFEWISIRVVFRRTRHRMRIYLRPESHYAGFESELNQQKPATNIIFRYFEKERFCQTSTKFCQTSFPPNLMPRDRGCAFFCLKQAFHWTGLKKSHFVKNYLHYFGVQTKLFVWDMCHTSLALSKSPNIINLIITLSSDMLSTNSDILSQ